MILIKFGSAERQKGPPTATGNEIRTGNGTENGSGKVGNARPKGSARRKAPENVLRVSTKEASVP
jgi:hypothetical protein